MSDLIYKSLDALESAKKVVAEAAAGIRDKARTISTSAIPEVLGAAGGIVAGVGTGLVAVYAAGTTGLSAVGITSGLATLGEVVGGGMAAESLLRGHLWPSLAWRGTDC